MQTMSTRIGGKDQTPNRALEGNVKTGSTRMTRMDPRLPAWISTTPQTRPQLFRNICYGLPAAAMSNPALATELQQAGQPKPDTVDTHASACMSTRMACKPCRPCRHASTLAAPLLKYFAPCLKLQSAKHIAIAHLSAAAKVGFSTWCFSVGPGPGLGPSPGWGPVRVGVHMGP